MLPGVAFWGKVTLCYFMVVIQFKTSLENISGKFDQTLRVFIYHYFSFLLFSHRSCQSMITDEDLMQRIPTLNFDLALIEAHFLPCSYIVPHIFKIPHVSYVHVM